MCIRDRPPSERVRIARIPIWRLPARVFSNACHFSALVCSQSSTRKRSEGVVLAKFIFAEKPNTSFTHYLEAFAMLLAPVLVGLLEILSCLNGSIERLFTDRSYYYCLGAFH